jgi:hypothetical protein
VGVIVYSPMASGLLTGTMTRERLAGLANAGIAQQGVADEQVSLITVRPLAGNAGQAIVKFTPSSSINASATGPMLPAGVESKVEQYLK